MPSLTELNIESLPELVITQGEWSASLHTLDYPLDEEGDHFYPVRYFVASKKDVDGLLRIHHLSLVMGEQRVNEEFQIEFMKPSVFKMHLPIFEKAELMDVYSLYEQFNNSTIHTLITGHYLATQHKPLFDGWLKAGKSPAELKAATDAYWKPLSEEAGGVIRLTARLYEELIALREISSPSLISVLMQTGPRTVHTRLTEARKTNLLYKPGTGSRK